MPSRSVKLLLIEDNESHAELVRRQLLAVREPRIQVEWVERLSEGVERAQASGIDAVLLDLSLPDSPLTETLDRFLSAVPDVPVVVLTTLDDMGMALDAVKRGAQDHLVKAQITPDLLTRSIGYAIERKRSQSQLERYAEELERSNRDFQQFAHVAAHELKSPLWSVSLACDVLADKHREQLDEDSRELLEGMSAAVRQMSQLINDLLEFARLGGLSKPPEPVDCNQALAQALELLKMQVEQSGAAVTHDGLTTIWAEPTQIRQLLQNLVANAIKYRRDEEPPRIHVAAQRVGREWVFSVRDNGLGIAPEYHHRIFGLFQRAHDRSKYPGTGLGLAICKRIVEHHGGRIWVESQPGQGSTFYFTLSDQPRPVESE